MPLRQTINFILIPFLIICLSSCNEYASATEYEMNFHGRKIDSTTGNREHSYIIQDHFDNNYELSLSSEKYENDKEVRDEDLTFHVFSYTQNKKITFEKILSGHALSRRIPVPRAEFTEENTALVYFENWGAQFVAGYVNGALASTNIFEFDLNGNGTILDTWQAGENEFIVTGVDRELYIYNMGKLYTRNLDNWDSITEIVDLGLADIKAEDIRTLFFDVSADSFSIYKGMDWGLDDPTKSKELLITVQTNK